MQASIKRKALVNLIETQHLNSLLNPEIIIFYTATFQKPSVKSSQKKNT